MRSLKSESISDLVSSTWSICSSAIHRVTAWRSGPARSISCDILCCFI